ncbi:MAG: hypothetical protein ACYDHY_14955 [Acidiferrobacterales bacterium]
MTINDQATRLTARVAPYLSAIQEAREAGLTWVDLAKALGVQSADRLRWAVKHCKYKTEQVPLPDPKKDGVAKAPEAPTAGKPPAIQTVVAAGDDLAARYSIQRQPINR